MNVFIARIQDGRGFLNEEESWHCCRVLRNQPGDVIKLIDGSGNFYEGILEIVSDKQCRVKITDGPRCQPERNYFLHLAIAPTKQIDRVEWLVEKAVELGVDELSFIYCENSERTQIKKERILKIVESAVKQSLQARIPVVNEMLNYKEVILLNTCEQKLIAHCHNLNKKPLSDYQFKDKRTLFLIGPEGDFTEEEINAATLNGFEAVSLGRNRLRTETAGLYVCQAVSILS